MRVRYTLKKGDKTGKKDTTENDKNRQKFIGGVVWDIAKNGDFVIFQYDSELWCHIVNGYEAVLSHGVAGVVVCES